MLKIYLFTVILCVILYENEADITTKATIDKLDFWSPDPKFDIKRSDENRRKMEKDEKDNKIYHKHNRVRTNPRFTKRTEKKSIPQKHKQRLTRGRYAAGHNKQRTKRPLVLNDLRGQDEREDKIWPRPKRVRHRSRHSDENGGVAFSTRIIPMHLMQQSNEKGQDNSTSQKSTAEDTKSEFISPYSLETQIRRILSHYPKVNVSIEVVGRTVEYNNILLVKLSEHKSNIEKYFRADESKYVEEKPEKKILFIVHGLSVLGITRLATMSKELYLSKLLSYYIHYLDMYDIFLMPMANPDGYIAEATREFWNKNMSPQTDCEGVSLDRNFDVAWNTAKVYSSCSQLYPGSVPFSEAESRAVRDVLHNYSPKIIAYIHVHSGTNSVDDFKGDAVLYPRGFSEIQSDDDKYIDMKGEIDEMMTNASFQVLTVTVDTLHNWYGKVSGSSVDYASTVYGIPYALEFVMQIYDNDDMASSVDQMVDYNALTVIWSRVIKVVFNSIWKNIHGTETDSSS